MFTSIPAELDPSSYVGSVYPIFPARLAQYFWAVKVTRKCEEHEDFCLEVTKSGNNSLPLANECLFIERLYLDEMQAGPTGNATVKPIVYHFSSKLF